MNLIFPFPKPFANVFTGQRRMRRSQTRTIADASTSNDNIARRERESKCIDKSLKFWLLLCHMCLIDRARVISSHSPFNPNTKKRLFSFPLDFYFGLIDAVFISSGYSSGY